jgi:hypothetical protein
VQFHKPSGIRDRIGWPIPVVEGDYFKAIGLPRYGDPSGFIDLIHGHLEAVEVILTIFGCSSAQGAGIADIDDLGPPSPAGKNSGSQDNNPDRQELPHPHFSLLSPE